MLDTSGFEKKLVAKKILITGDTGFTGSWASLWLKKIGVDVIGCSLPPNTNPSMYEATGIAKDINMNICDIRNYDELLNVFQKYNPDLVLHLAAQALVRKSYREPLETIAINTLGTASVLEVARKTRSVVGVLCITTDKVYKNNEWVWGYRESDQLGGKDPYSASKSAAEMIIDSYAASFSPKQNNGPYVATARGGNIIGGGDWAEDRLIPDFVRAVVNKAEMTIRYPEATRPWQHVLALVQGYLMILAGLIENPEKYARAWNFGPSESRDYSVKDVFEILSAHWTRPNLSYMHQPLPEARALALDSSLARKLLGWNPAWGTEDLSWRRQIGTRPITRILPRPER